MSTEYNQVEYHSLPHVRTHPNYLWATATLWGATVTLPRHARILEIGCGTGGNLIPMADTLNEARCVGIDLSSRAIAAAEQDISSLGLKNITVTTADLQDFKPESHSFDYVIVHGVYSWVSREVQDKLLALIAE